MEIIKNMRCRPYWHIAAILACCSASANVIAAGPSVNRLSDACASYYSVFSVKSPSSGINKGEGKRRYYYLRMFGGYWPVPIGLIVQPYSGGEGYSIEFRPPYAGKHADLQGAVYKSLIFGPDDEVSLERSGKRFGIVLKRRFRTDELTFSFFDYNSPPASNVQLSACLVIVSDGKNDLSIHNFSPAEISRMYSLFLQSRDIGVPSL